MQKASSGNALQTQQKRLRQPYKGVTNDRAREGRLEFLKSIGKELPSFEDSFLSASQVKSNIESFIGTFSMPVGLVGPLLFEKERDVYEQVFTNIATTEGALAASMNRGASIISACGGFKAHVQRQTMLRSPLFCFEDLYQAQEFAEWIVTQKDKLNEHIKKYSKRANLTEIKTNLMGKNVDCKFYYTTGDAAGQNMTTICTWHSCLWIEETFNALSEFPIQEFVLEGNGASDKKVSYNSIANGRGINVVAEVVLDEEVIQKRLKTTSDALIRFFNRTYQLTSIDGMIGNNINIANSIAAIFAVTGQDIACVHESAVGFLHFEKHPRGLYISLKLPRLVIGTVGGGTGLPHQRESLELMDCYGAGKVERFAKLIAGFALGLEISTVSAMVSHQFAIAHEKLGRNKPVDFFTKKELTADFVTEKVLYNKTQQVEFATQMNESNGIITQLSSDKTEKYIGLSVWSVRPEGEERTLSILKSKTTDAETINCMYVLTGMVDPKLAKSFGSYCHKSEFENCHEKEILIYDHLNAKNSIYTPKVYGTHHNAEREISLILMEFLQDGQMQIINSEMKPNLWTDEALTAAIKGICHAQKELKDLDTKKAKVKFQSFNTYRDYSRHALDVLEVEYGSRFADILKIMKGAWSYLANNEELVVKNLAPVIVHNDFNPRNIAISNEGIAKIYDWELAAIDVPQRDIVELLSFIYESENLSLDIMDIIRLHLEEFNRLNNTNYDMAIWMEGYKYAYAKYLCTRLPMYLLGNRLSPYPFLSKVIKTIVNFNNNSGFDLC